MTKRMIHQSHVLLLHFRPLPVSFLSARVVNFVSVHYVLARKLPNLPHIESAAVPRVSAHLDNLEKEGHGKYDFSY